MWWNMKNSGFIKICIIFAFILVIAISVFLITSYMYNSKGNEINDAMSSELSQKDSIQSTKETAKINISNESPEQTTYINKENEHSKEEILSKKVEESLAKMTLEEKVAQLFFVTPEALTGIAQVTRAAEQSKNSFNEYPVGGLVYFSENFESPEQTKQMLKNMKKIANEKSCRKKQALIFLKLLR